MTTPEELARRNIDVQPFYIGKGKGNRCFAHLNDTSESEKVKRIAELRKIGLEPKIELLGKLVTASWIRCGILARKLH